MFWCFIEIAAILLLSIFSLVDFHLTPVAQIPCSDYYKCSINVDFDLSPPTRIPYVKHTNCENSRSAAKEALILLRS